jgi:predicted nucleotidyltransferase
MRVVGIVVEYNPFHNGHLYQIERVKELFEDSIIVVAMSGYYTERGEVSVLSKWDKAQLALMYGVDVVLEIPFVFSNQSADVFSYAAIKMLSEFKIDVLVFGSESADVSFLKSVASVQICNPSFDSLVKNYVSEGLNYPTSLSKAIFDLTGFKVSEPNDVLAVSYIKEILRNNLDIEIFPLKRTNSFLDLSIDEVIVSASNVRNRLSSGEDISKYVPSGVVNYVRNVNLDYLFQLIRYKIISERDSLEKYHLVDEGIDNRIYEASLSANNYFELVDMIKTKRYTYNKINRILINIFVGFTKDEANKFKSLDYIRVLGFSSMGRKFYSSIKNDISLPVIHKFEKFDMMQIEFRAAILYSMLINDKSIIDEEIKKHVIVL